MTEETNQASAPDGNPAPTAKKRSLSARSRKPASGKPASGRTRRVTKKRTEEERPREAEAPRQDRDSNNAPEAQVVSTPHAPQNPGGDSSDNSGLGVERRRRRRFSRRGTGGRGRSQRSSRSSRDGDRSPRSNDGFSDESSRAEGYADDSARETDASGTDTTVYETYYSEGVIEISGKGFGFLRDPKRAFQQHPQDVFVTPEMVRRYGLRDGMLVGGDSRKSQRGPQMTTLLTVNGGDPDRFKYAPIFEELTTLNPEKRIVLETLKDRHTTRVMDLITPIGCGQRGLIVAPPRTGKTTLLQHIAEAVTINHPELHLMVLLVDERPEEVTEIRMNLPTAELWASSNDSDVKSHTRIAQLCMERAKRMVEDRRDVFLLLDSLTRVGRAFNNAMQGTGRTLSGGMDVRGMEIPRKIFAAARNTEEAGSLTIMATALIETGSRMDELIFQEFKGTGNMELVLDRRIAEQRVYPAVDIFKSGTRREELLLSEEALHKISTIRRGLSGHKPIEAIERLLFFIRKFDSNTAMLAGIPG